MSQLIESILQDRAKTLQEAEAEKRAKRLQEVSDLLSSLHSFLGEFVSLIQERKIPYFVDSRDKLAVGYEIPALDDLRLAPIVIRWNSYSGSSNYIYRNEIFRVRGYQFGNLAEALAAARNQYEPYKEDLKEKAIEEFEKVFRYDSRGKKTEEDLRALVEAHIAEYPDREEAARKFLANEIEWRKNRAEAEEQDRREREIEEANKTHKKMIALDYVINLAHWIEKRDFILDKNRLYASAMQEKADEWKYIAGRLTYALIGEYEEDGETDRMIETRSVYTASLSPDTSGFWAVDGKKDPIRFKHEVSIEKVEVAPSSGILAKKLEKGGVEIFFAPGVPDKTIADIAANIEDLPEEPEAPEELRVSEYYKSEWYRKAHEYLRERAAEEGEETEGEEEEDREIPF